VRVEGSDGSFLHLSALDSAVDAVAKAHQVVDLVP
jgi:hypothetical protein